MKKFSILILIFFCVDTLCQDNKFLINFLFNKGHITYVDNINNAYYTITFKADTVVQVNKKDLFVMDSSMVQIHNYPILEYMYNYKYDSTMESELLLHFKDYEFDYMQDEVYKVELKAKDIFFNNKNSKRFLIWYFEVPKKSNLTDTLVQKSDTSIIKEAKVYYKNGKYLKNKTYETPVKYQLYFAFVANSYVSMTNIAVLENEDINKLILRYKTDIANSVRIYDNPINTNVLNNQIINKLSGKDFIINDTLKNFQITIPYWLNITDVTNRYLVGAFPDINNISNSFLMDIYNKSNYDSFEAFKNSFLTNKGVVKYEIIDSKNVKINNYLVYFQASRSMFKCQDIFFDSGKYYGLVIFTATPDTYDKNVSRFNEFKNKIKIK